MSRGRELQRRLDVAASLQNIVLAMRSWAATTLRQVEDQVTVVREMTERVERAMAAACREMEVPLPAPVAEASRHGFVVYSSDHGLAGQYTEEIVRFVAGMIRSRKYTRDQYLLVVVGERGKNLLQAEGLEVASHLPAPTSIAGIHSAVNSIAVDLYDLYREGRFDRLSAIYHRYEGIGAYSPRVEQILPVDLREICGRHADTLRGYFVHRTVPPSVLLTELVEERTYLELSRAYIEAAASENGARLKAMNLAASNVERQRERLENEYRQYRQEQITSELLELASGAEAVSGSED